LENGIKETPRLHYGAGEAARKRRGMLPKSSVDEKRTSGQGTQRGKWRADIREEGVWGSNFQSHLYYIREDRKRNGFRKKAMSTYLLNKYLLPKKLGGWERKTANCRPKGNRG